MLIASIHMSRADFTSDLIRLKRYCNPSSGKGSASAAVLDMFKDKRKRIISALRIAKLDIRHIHHCNISHLLWVPKDISPVLLAKPWLRRPIGRDLQEGGPFIFCHGSEGQATCDG